MLTYITRERCPVCGSDVVTKEEIEVVTNQRTGERRIRTTADGGQWEYKVFLCGYAMEYNPIYQKVRKTGECQTDPRVICKRKKAEADRDKIMRFLIQEQISSEVADPVRSLLS